MKMNRQENICKFITHTSTDTITTTNFVFEKRAENRASMTTPKTNAVYLVVSGKGALHTKTGTRELCPRTIFFTFAQIPFRIENIEGLQYMYISFQGERSEELFARFGISPKTCVFEGHEGLTAFWQNAIAKANQKNLDLISESVLLYTFGEMTPPKITGEHHLIGSILTYINDHFSDSNLNLPAVGDALGYNCKYVSRVFKETMGISFSAYLTNLRIQYAIFLIDQGVTAIKNISLLSGYKDPFYFSKVFKSVVGFSPREYINRQTE